MGWLADHLWMVPVSLSALAWLPFLWTIYSPGNGPDGAMEASMLFFFAVTATVVLWGLFGAYWIVAAIYVGLQT